MNQPGEMSRRSFVWNAARGASALAALPILGCRGAAQQASPQATGPASRVIPLDRGWLFGGKFRPETLAPAFDDAAFERISLPHCVAKLSWKNWDPAAWHDVWIYRRHFAIPEECRGSRIFLHFDGVMVGTTPTLNGHNLDQHLGGYLPSQYELTPWISAGENVLAVAVDSRWSNVPPEGAPVGPRRVDYLEPGGIVRGVRLKVVPPVFIADVFAKPVQVLDAARHIQVQCTLDAAEASPLPMELHVELRSGGRRICSNRQPVRIDSPGATEITLTLSKLGNVSLWDIESPHLYDVVATLIVDGRPVHDHRVRLGLREARFTNDGFFLNGRRLQIFGLNRHELFPYVGGAMPRRVMRRDARILRHAFHCNMVRCSHYPQTEAFLDACDELGMMVWEEVPGWGYIGDAAWQELLVRDAGDMVRRDRNHPSIIIWGVRVNESANNESLYSRTRALAKSLDGSRPTSGSMTSHKARSTGWHEDVFAFDDYHAEPDGSVGILDPLPGVPYMLSEAVGQFNYSKRKNFDAKYRRAGDVALQQAQALRHAQAHSRAASKPRICGVIAWCAFDYGSLINPYEGVKCPGVADVFRIPKLGAAFYQAQGDPKQQPVILPNFYWDFGPQTPRGPGTNVAIFSNCDRLKLFVDGKAHADVHPDTSGYPHLRHAPFFVDLDLDGSALPELRIDGYVNGDLALSRSFSADPSQDQFLLHADDSELMGDGSDATRLVFGRVDRYGSPRAFATGTVTLEIRGPGTILGDNPFELADAGGIGAVWIRTTDGGAGRIEITATHSQMGAKRAVVAVTPA